MLSVNCLSVLLKFSPVPVSVLTVLIYGIIFTSVLVTDQTPDIPKHQGGLDLNKAYDDLHKITAHPHPYNSHANDEVHAFLLSRLQPIASKHDYIHLSNDIVSNASYATASLGSYFEGSNILVKIVGTDPSTAAPDGVLFSAHYDSVSTAPGATDNSMSVATILQMIEYLSHPDRRPRRTAVFLLNNGEEDGLNGAQLFYEHPWSNLTTTFVNLEGAGAGGRPLLFRSTSLRPARAFGSSAVTHPHANVLSADAFERGLIRSRTDYQVFANGIKGETDGMSGVDLAFYKNRALYHTPLDSIPGMGRSEGRRSLWAMMEAATGMGMSLLNDDILADGGDGGVYFDVLGSTLIIFPLRSLFITNIVLLAVGPISTLVLLAWVVTISRKHTSSSAPDQEVNTWSKVTRVLTTVIGWGRFWIAILICIAAQVGFVFGSVKLNKFVIHSHPFAVLITTFAISYLALVVPLWLFHIFFPSPQSSQKLAIILEIFFLTWILTLLSTIAVQKFRLGGLYWITAWYICAWVGSLVALIEAAARAKKGGEEGGKGELNLVGEEEPLISEEEPEGRRLVRGVLYEAPEDAGDGQNGDQSGEPIETEPTEITPLMHQHRHRSQGGREYIVGIDNELIPVHDADGKAIGYEETGWWILQLLVMVPLPALLISQIQLMLLHSLKNTLVDGSSPVIAYGGISALSVLPLLNLAPFAHRIHRTLTLAILVIFALTLTYSWVAFPFTQEAPLKLFFQQQLDLDLNFTHSMSQGSLLRAVTSLTGPRGFVDEKIIPDLPSSWGQLVACQVDDELRPGLHTCSWDTSLFPSPGGNNAAHLAPLSLLSPAQETRASVWLDVTVTRLNSSSAVISVQGTNSRSCRLTFDKPIASYSVLDASSNSSLSRFQPGFEVPEEGIRTIMLWSRTWSNKFVVKFSWSSELDESMDGRVACEWVEYASASAGSPNAATSGQIPALEEVLRFLPLWATATKWTYGLVEAGGKFSI